MAPRTSRLALAILGCLAGCGGDDGKAADAGPIDATPPGGTFRLSWSLTDSAGGGAIECADVAGATVRVTATPIDAVAGFVEPFSCGTGGGTSGQQPPGRYALTADLRTQDGDSLIEAPVALQEIELVRGGEDEAGSATFAVERSGSVSFQIDASGDGPSCGAVDAGGGGMTGVVFELTDDAGACVDGAVLTIGAGGGGAGGTYTTSCAAPPVFDCIENDQAITLGPRLSGRYDLAVTGQKAGAIACFGGGGALSIPGNGLADAIGTLGLALAPTVDCDPALLPDAGPL